MSRATVWTPERKATARKLDALRIPLTDIAERFGVSPSAVQTMLGRHHRGEHRAPHYVPIVPLRMIVSPWYVDVRDGLPTRTVRAAQ